MSDYEYNEDGDYGGDDDGGYGNGDDGNDYGENSYDDNTYDNSYYEEPEEHENEEEHEDQEEPDEPINEDEQEEQEDPEVDNDTAYYENQEGSGEPDNSYYEESDDKSNESDDAQKPNNEEIILESSENNEVDEEITLENSHEVEGSDVIPAGGSEFKGLLDGFGGSSFGDIASSIANMASESGALSNMFIANGGMESIVQKMISSAAHHFLHIDPNTGNILGSVLGNLIFNFGGQHNSLSSIGKVILDNLISGNFRRDIQPFTPIPHGQSHRSSFNLNFQNERDKCLQEHRLFEDPEFPADLSSIWYKSENFDQSVQWLRPGQITDQPQLIVGEKSRFDVKQGELGDCWLLAAAANLTLRDELFYRIVPPDQSFTENYAGIFHFQFWRYGQWVDVVIDDRLPCRDGKLIFMHSQKLNEFWSALLEKAYAKMYGSYEHLEGGTIAEALEDFTGGLTESMNLKKSEKSVVLAMIIRGMQMGSLFGCSIHAKDNEKEARLDNGLVCGHAYSITSIQSLKSFNNQVIIRLRNPWGNSKEWNGPWSDGSIEWDRISNEEKQTIGLNFDTDGEFWMSFDDFLSHFDELEVCNLSADVMNEISQMTGVNMGDANVKSHKWDEKAENGEWSVAQGNAGGCMNYPDTYGRNPQFSSYFVVSSDSIEQDGSCTVIVAVLQKFRREQRNIGEDYLPIGFSIYQVNDVYGEQNAVPHDFFSTNRPITKTKTFINQREMTLRVRLKPGRYIIVPSTFEPNQDGFFLLRIFANSNIQTIRLQ